MTPPALTPKGRDTFVLSLVDRRDDQAKPTPKVAGMTTALRLALGAQAAGARAIHLGHGAEHLAASLHDPRLKIAPRADAPEDDVVVIEVASNVVLHRGLFAALRDAVADGRARSCGSSDAAVHARPPTLARASGGPPVPFVFAPPFGFPPIAIHSRRDARRATTMLLRSLRKTQDGWTSTYLNRHVSLALTRLLVHTPLRPNQLSVAILGVGIASGVVAARGSRDALILGAALLQVQSVLDGCDGELSRITFRGSKLGEWLDTIGDDVSNYGFFAGASYGLYRAGGGPAYLAIGAIVVGCGLLTSGLEYRYLASIGSGDLARYPLGLAEDAGRPTTMVGGIVAAIQPLFKRDTFVLLTFIAATVGLLGPMLAVFAVGGIGIVVAVIKAELRMARERAARRTG